MHLENFNEPDGNAWGRVQQRIPCDRVLHIDMEFSILQIACRKLAVVEKERAFRTCYVTLNCTVAEINVSDV
jgi:hypothetical protein